jgi:hypothetical protein
MTSDPYPQQRPWHQRVHQLARCGRAAAAAAGPAYLLSIVYVHGHRAFLRSMHWLYGEPVCRVEQEQPVPF